MPSTCALHVIAVEATGALEERFTCRSSARMPAAILHAIGTPTVAWTHGRRYAL